MTYQGSGYLFINPLHLDGSFTRVPLQCSPEKFYPSAFLPCFQSKMSTSYHFKLFVIDLLLWKCCAADHEMSCFHALVSSNVKYFQSVHSSPLMYCLLLHQSDWTTHKLMTKLRRRFTQSDFHLMWKFAIKSIIIVVGSILWWCAVSLM